MSPHDVLAELHTAQVEAPPQLRARVRLIAAQAPPARRLTRRRLALLVPAVVAAAAIAAVVISTRSTGPHATHGEIRASASTALAPKAAAIAPARGRAQRYEASLRLRVAGVSDAVKRALNVTASLGGYPQSVHVSTGPQAATAELVLRVPRAHVQQAIGRLTALGTIVGEQVDIQDLQAGINASDRRIARLQRQLAALRAQPQTDVVKRRIAALTARVVALQRARASTLRAAHFATVRLSLSSSSAPKRHTHYLRDALPWVGGAAVVLLLLLALRVLRRLREDALLRRP
jgi:Domain of unknown function (DUF4349)